jgi:NAD(P)-dependent dehydrogenase (short-subunit alcohol dehydrogenase family)
LKLTTNPAPAGSVASWVRRRARQLDAEADAKQRSLRGSKLLGGRTVIHITELSQDTARQPFKMVEFTTAVEKSRMKLAGRVALVTGAQQGIGAAIAVALAEEGADVALTWLDDERAAAAVAARVHRAGRRVHLVRVDVARLADIEMMVADTVHVLGAPDILVNNAGVYPRVKLIDMRESDWDYVLDINLKACCFATIAVVKALIAAGKGSGSVLNISSQAIRGAVRGVHYSASKGGVVSMTRAMALELAPYNIRVNAIAPGTTDTAQPRYGNSDAELIEMARAIPLGGKMLTPNQIARTAVFLASEDANAITGQVVHVNGGSYMP